MAAPAPVASPIQAADFVRVGFDLYEQGVNRATIGKAWGDTVLAMAGNLAPVIGLAWTAIQLLEAFGVIRSGVSANPKQLAYLAALNIPPETVVDLAVLLRERTGSDQVWTRVVVALLLEDLAVQERELVEVEVPNPELARYGFFKPPHVPRTIRRSYPLTLLQRGALEGRVRGLSEAGRRALQPGSFAVPMDSQVGPSEAWGRRFAIAEAEALGQPERARRRAEELAELWPFQVVTTPDPDPVPDLVLEDREEDLAGELELPGEVAPPPPAEDTTPPVVDPLEQSPQEVDQERELEEAGAPGAGAGLALLSLLLIGGR